MEMIFVVYQLPVTVLGTVSPSFTLSIILTIKAGYIAEIPDRYSSGDDRCFKEMILSPGAVVDLVNLTANWSETTQRLVLAIY